MSERSDDADRRQRQYQPRRCGDAPGIVRRRGVGSGMGEPKINQVCADDGQKKDDWNPRFPGQISSQLAIAEELTGNVINLEGQDLVSVPLGFTDTASTTCLHVPSIGLIVAGDAAYNGVHL